MISRIRVTFSKDGPMQYTGHLDLARTWARLLRRAKLPVVHSQGFNPQPKINLAAALPLGFTSNCEMIDIWLEEEFPLEEVEKRIFNASPPGLAVLQVQSVDPSDKTLQSQLESIEYEVTVENALGLEEKIQALLSAETLPRERRGKSYDLKPLLESIWVIDDQTLGMRLTSKPGGTGRPDEVIEALEIDPLSVEINRTKITTSAL